ncbi:MAG TPA: hypothetical protein VN641_03600 [Urbifossiella sp.]|nr:hypothetical protein [Urbifossiella sp.]
MSERAELHDLRERIARLPVAEQLLLADEIQRKHANESNIARASYFNALRADVELVRGEEASANEIEHAAR